MGVIRLVLQTAPGKIVLHKVNSQVHGGENLGHHTAEYSFDLFVGLGYPMF